MATEKRLIDANKVRSKAIQLEGLDGNGIPYEIMAVPVDAIDDAPTMDAVEVVRCEKCQYWNPRYETMGMCMKHNSIVTFTKPDFYCAWGKDKNDGICKES